MAQVDFYNMLSGLGDVIAKNRKESARREALSGAIGPDGTVDFSKAVLGLTRAGDMEMAARVSQLANAAEDRAWRRSEADRAQGNADRSFGLQQQTANTAQIVMVEGPDGLKHPVRVDRNGGAMPINIPGMQPAPGNPFLTGKPGTEGQQNAQLYATRMMNSEKILRDPSIVDAATSYGQAAISGIPGFIAPQSIKNTLHSGAYQKYDQAQRDFVNAVLRRESGAVISDQEFENARRQYFPQPGDNKETIAQKQRNRAEAIKGIGAAGGPGYRPPMTFGPNGELVPQAITKQDYDALPSGSVFTAPDGSRRVKP